MPDTKKEVKKTPEECDDAELEKVTGGKEQVVEDGPHPAEVEFSITTNVNSAAK